MATPEGKVKEQVKKLLRKHGVYWHCPVQNGMGSPSLDFICCAWGHYLAIETKAPGKEPTPRQWNTIEAIEKSGGTVIVIDSVENCANLVAWLTSKQPKVNEYAGALHTWVTQNQTKIQNPK